MRWKRVVLFLLINVLVSAGATLLVLNLWDRYRTPQTNPTDVISDYVPLPTTQEPAPLAPIPTATLALQAYRVQPGETLGEIALAFDISVEELLELNGRSDPDAIGQGEIVYVPAPIEAGDTSPDAFTAQQVDPNLPVEVEIVTVVSVGDLDTERVQIRGIGDGSVTLTAWQLADEDGNRYVFPTLVLFNGGAVNVFSRAGVDTVVSLYWGQTQAVWSSGETLRLVDADGRLRAIYTIP